MPTKQEVPRREVYLTQGGPAGTRSILRRILSPRARSGRRPQRTSTQPLGRDHFRDARDDEQIHILQYILRAPPLPLSGK